MDISGNLSKGSGTFRIDHPLDPTNKWLNHSFVESDEVLNIYRGKVTLNNQGRATVTMPDWFLEINTEFSYSLTCTGSHSDVFISKELGQGNGAARRRFQIDGGASNQTISWVVYARRNDTFILENPVIVEQDKPEAEKTLILHEREFERRGRLPPGYVKRKDRPRRPQRRPQREVQ